MSFSLLVTVYCLCVVVASLAGGAVPSFVKLSHRHMQLLMSFVGGFHVLIMKLLVQVKVATLRRNVLRSFPIARGQRIADILPHEMVLVLDVQILLDLLIDKRIADRAADIDFRKRLRHLSFSLLVLQPRNAFGLG